MVDDKAQLASANNEVLRLKQLLQHALRRAEGGKDNDGESGSGSLLQENMQLREENDRLREEIMAYEAMFTQDSGTIERDRRGRVKPPKNKGSIQNALLMCKMHALFKIHSQELCHFLITISFLSRYRP